MDINWNVTKTTWYTSDAWRAAHHPDAIKEATEIGEQIITLLTQATTLVERACDDVDSIVHNATLRCQAIIDRLIGETDRLEPALTRLRAASKAVKS
jgi:hypothetical protein